MTTPAPRYVCPRCRASYVEPLRFCQQCGANMQRASALELAAQREGVSSDDLASVVASGSGPETEAWQSVADRRVSASAATWLGRIVDGRYRVIEVVGRGGMGVVYKVEHVRMGKIAAMKVLHKDLAGDPEVVRRFEREAAMVSRLDHPNTAQVFDFGAIPDGLYLIMEMVRGLDLGHIVERDGPLPFARAAPLFIQVCGALGEAHDLGIVHRDLKPENVLITRTTGGRDFAKVLDFGLAKLSAREPDPNATDKTEIVGTPYFMSPEQIRGEDVDARADVYSLGALMYTVLIGKPPFTAKSAVGVLTKHLTAEVTVPSMAAPDAGLTEEIDAIVLRALEKDPAQRWQTVAEMASAIERVYAEQVGDRTPIHLPRSTESGRRRLTEGDEEPVSELNLRRSDLDDYERSLKRRRVFVSVGTAVALAAVAAAAGWWLWLRPQPTHTSEVEPNDDDAHATLIAPNTDVTGYLGKRISPTEPDVDVYEIAWPAGEPHLVTLRVTGIPNLDVTLALRDARGRQIASTDVGEVGMGEVLHRWRVEGPIFVEVGEAMHDQRFPVENVSDPYTLSVTVDQPDPGWESEPNGNGPDATPLEPGSSMKGWLEAPGETDDLRWDGPSGKVTVELTCDRELPVRWIAPDGSPHPPGTTTISIKTGDHIHLERTDGLGKHARPGIDAQWSVTVTPTK